MSMFIGSGDIADLLSGKNTKGHNELLKRFVSIEKPHYNAKASPIDALRIGAILESNYYHSLPFGYLPQFVVYSSEMTVFRATLDNALVDNGIVLDFDELKSVNFDDFRDILKYKDTDYSKYILFIKRKYKHYYNQIQEQLLCTGLNECNLVFIAVYSYKDEDNIYRIIDGKDLIKFRIQRDESVISIIKERAKIFQTIKDYYSCTD